MPKTMERFNSMPQRETILLVEDEPAIRMLLASALNRKGFQVLEADNGGSALGLSQSFPGRIELLLTDIHMPGVDGVVLSEAIKAERSGIRIIQMSGGCSRGSVVDGVNVPFLQKPFAMNTLMNKIDEVLGDVPALIAA